VIVTSCVRAGYDSTAQTPDHFRQGKGQMFVTRKGIGTVYQPQSFVNETS
jgi:hypothetical protein